MKPALGKRAFIPYRLLSSKAVREAKRSLTFTEVSADRVSHILGNVEDADHYDYGDHVHQEPGNKVTINECRHVAGGISVPRAWAVDNYPHLPWVDRTVFPKHNIKFTGNVTPRDKQQELFFERLMTAAETNGPQNILANATTGSGKTVAAIFMGWQLQTPTLIIVDSNKIARGWLKNFRKFFGQGWTERNVGRAQQDTCNYQGKAFVIAMAQSLAIRDYGQDFIRNFGFVVVDEVQVFGGPHFSPLLYKFPARVRAYFTAENRSGQFGKLIKTHTGKPRVISKQEVLKPDAWILKNTMTSSFYALSDGAILTNLARQSERNHKLANLITSRGWERKRNVLVLSNRTFQLQDLKRRCGEMGVPLDEMGIHAGTYETERYVVYYTNKGSTKRNRLCVADTYSRGQTMIRQVKRGEYERFERFPTALYNRLQAGEDAKWELKREQYSPSQTELDNITHSCQIIFATYEIFSKGVDVPRLDMGVEALPAGNVKQPVGRVLRISEGKPTPEWYAIHDIVDIPQEGVFPVKDQMADILNQFFTAKTKARRNALKNAGARIKFQ